MVIGKSWTGQCDDAQAQRQQPQKKEQPASRRTRGRSSRPGDIGAGKTQRAELSDAAVQKGVNGQQSQQEQQPGILKLEVTVHELLLLPEPLAGAGPFALA